MKRFPRRLLFALLLVLVYIVWHPVPTRRELTIRPAWGIDLRTEVVRRSTEGGLRENAGDLIPVAGNGVFAYLSEDGGVVHHGRTGYRVALSPAGYVNYGQMPAQLVVQDPDAGFRASIPTRGYPFFLGERLLVVAGGGTRLAEWTLDGVLRWQIDLPAPIASVAGAAGRTGLGLLAGGALLLEPDGSRVELQRPTAVIEPVVHAVSVSEEPARFAVVAAAAGAVTGDAVPGDAAARISVTLYDVADGRGVPVVRRTVPRVADGPQFVRLVDNGRALVYAAGGDPTNSLVSLDVETGDDVFVPVRFAPIDLREIPELGLRVAISMSSRRDPARGFARPSELTVFSRDGLRPIRTSWAADIAALERHGELLIVRIDERFLAFALEVE